MLVNKVYVYIIYINYNRRVLYHISQLKRYKMLVRKSIYTIRKNVKMLSSISINMSKKHVFSLSEDKETIVGFPWDQSKEVYIIENAYGKRNSFMDQLNHFYNIMKINKSLIIYLRYKSLFEGNTNDTSEILDSKLNINEVTTIMGSKLITGLLKGLQDFTTYTDPNDNYFNNLSIVKGSKIAFECSTNAIFHHKDLRALQIINNNNNNNNTINDDKKITTSLDSDDKIDKHMIEKGELFIPNLTSIFEKNLASFYEDAISTIQKSQCKLGYKLISIEDVLITNVSTIIGAKRGSIGNDKLMKTKGSYLEGNCSYALPAQPLNMETVDELLKHKTYNFHTISCKVDVQCTEIFYVIDEVTGKILQGSKDPTRTIHEIVLETVIDLSKRQLSYEWIITDIDNWLNGNEFMEESDK